MFIVGKTQNRCRFCGKMFTVTQKMIDRARDEFDPDVYGPLTDDEIANYLEGCGDCAGLTTIRPYYIDARQVAVPRQENKEVGARIVVEIVGPKEEVMAKLENLDDDFIDDLVSNLVDVLNAWAEQELPTEWTLWYPDQF